MIKIAPSILAANFGHLNQEIRSIDEANCDYIHCDIMDGHFVPNISFGPEIVKIIRSITKKKLDVHLMINSVSQYIENFVTAGADIITFHIEADQDPIKIINKIKKFNVQTGIALKPDTSIDSIIDVLEYVDLVLVMTVEPGFGGQKFIESQLIKIKKLKNIIDKKLLNIDIEVDGGINIQTGKNCIDAGANILVAGSYIFNKTEDKYKQAIQLLRQY